MTDCKLLCIYHANCADGFASAWAVHRRFGDEVEFVAAKYGDIVGPPLLSPDRDVLIVDFSFPRRELEAMAEVSRSVLVLDHHATARDQLADLNAPSGDWEDWLKYCHAPDYEIGGLLTLAEDRLAAIFDMERSGAGLTWDYLHPGVPRPRLVDLVEDRDLWRFAHDPDTRRFHAVAASYGYEATTENFARWDKWADWANATDRGDYLYRIHIELWKNTLAEGEAILRYEAKLVDGILAGARRTMRLAGHVVPVACCPDSLASEVGNRLCRGEPASGTILPGYTTSYDYETIRDGGIERAVFSATYYDGSDGRRHFSLRSPKGGADVQVIARELGVRFGRPGGGHPNAAGFEAPLGWEGE